MASRRIGLVVCAAAVVVGLGAIQTTSASYTDTVVNSAAATTQAVFPPLNTSAPGISQTVGGLAVSGLTEGLSLTAGTGTWATNHALDTTYAFRWQRCTATCTDIGGATGAVYVVTAADAGAGLRVVVTATDANAAVTPRNTIAAASAQVS
jgi:hypothetical protein